MTYNDKKSDLVYEPSTIENVDMAMYNWLNEKMNLFADTNKGWIKIPVIWVSGERSWQVKNKQSLRDNNNNFILPVLTIERTEMIKDPQKKGKYWGDVRPIDDEKGGSIVIHRVLNQGKTSNFANAYTKRLVGQPNFKRENKKIVYQSKMIPMPVYVTMNYLVDIKAEYQQQMNQILQPFLTFTGGVNYFIVENEGHRYEAFIDSNLTQKNNGAELQENERIFNTQINIKVLSHLVGQTLNDQKPKVAIRENIVEVKFQREYSVYGGGNTISPEGFTDYLLRDENGDFIVDENGDFIKIK